MSCRGSAWVMWLAVGQLAAGAPGGWAQAIPSAMSETAPQIISLDLKGVDILDVLKLLSEHSGLNFVAGRNVSGRITVFAKDVDVWEAFERIVEANELAYERRGELVNVMTARDYELLYGVKFQERTRTQTVPLAYAKAAQFAAVLNQLKSTVGRIVMDEPSNTVIVTDVPTRLDEMMLMVRQLDRPTVSRIYALHYADAEKLRDKLQELLTPGVGTVSIDPRTNKVAVTDLEHVLPKVERLLRAFDEPAGEVLIEAKIMKVELNDEQSLGVDWQQTLSGADTKARANFRVLSDIVDGSGTGAALKFLAAPSGKTQIVVEALKKVGKVETVANPRITVLSEQEAKILVGTKEAFVTVTTTVPTTGSVVTSPQIEFVDVGTKLFVTPSIKRDGHVQLTIRPEVSTARIETFQSNRIPIVSTTEAETTVLVKSGSTLIIGGLIDKKTERTKQQVPWLGDLPILGAAFRSRVDTKKTVELVVFLTPQIISTSGEPITDFSSAGAEGAPPAVSEEYQALIRALLSSQLAHVLRTMGAGAGSVTYAFTLDQRGRLVGSPEISSPQGERFVAAAHTAFQALDPFPPFPSTPTAEQIRFRMAIEYRPRE